MKKRRRLARELKALEEIDDNGTTNSGRNENNGTEGATEPEGVVTDVIQKNDTKAPANRDSVTSVCKTDHALPNSNHTISKQAQDELKFENKSKFMQQDGAKVPQRAPENSNTVDTYPSKTGPGPSTLNLTLKTSEWVKFKSGEKEGGRFITFGMPEENLAPMEALECTAFSGTKILHF